MAARRRSGDVSRAAAAAWPSDVSGPGGPGGPGSLAGLGALGDRFLAARGFDRQLAADLAALAAGRGGGAWESRRLAALMLHRQVLAIPPADLPAHLSLLALLGLAPDAGGPLDRRLLSEGFTSTEPRRFVRELRAWLARGAWWFSDLRGAATPAADLDAFAARARAECRLPLARWLFGAAEVVERITGQLRVSRGVATPLALAGGLAAPQAERVLSRLPAYEAAIAAALCDASLVYWVADATPSRFNALLAQPPATVAMAVRPPGSSVEIQIKRTGCRGPHAWDVIVRRDRKPLPFTHRFAGASLLPSLQRDARESSRLAALFRRAHTREAPLGSVVATTAVYGVPSPAGEEAHVLDYFLDPAAFGAGFPAMRRAMRELVDSCRYAAPDWHTAALESDLGLTLQFLHHYPPGQAILCGTSSLRLDRAARYLGGAAAAAEREHGDDPERAGTASPAGADAAAGASGARPRRPGRPRHTRELTDAMLDEVLGLYTPPRVPYVSQRRYVQAAFAVPANRARADRVHASLMRQLGRLWGTLLAVRGYSRGESFVSRNVGLRSAFERGRWRVRLVSMDHDDLTIPNRRESVFRPARSLPYMELDEVYVIGRVRPVVPHQPIGAAEFLARIYRIDRPGARAGRAALRREAARAYHRTQAAVRRLPDLAALFHPDFVRRLGDWDAIARRLLATPRGGERGAAFAAAVRRRLRAAGYPQEAIEEHLAAARDRAEQIRRWAFLWGRRRG